MSFLTAAVAIGGAVYSADSARKASHTQADAARNAQQIEQDQFNQSRQDLQPWQQGGQQGLNALLQYLGISQDGFDPNAAGVKPFQFSQQDPSYQWRFQQGENALLNARSALGGLGGGNTQKALTQYGQGMASQEYGNEFARYMQQQQAVYNKLAGLSDTGANTAGGIARLGASVADSNASLQTNIGQANAAGTLGQDRAYVNGINQLAPWLSALSQQNSLPNYGTYATGPGMAQYGGPGGG